jgi:asparagine synthase (glutamine-hydrolysing)
MSQSRRDSFLAIKGSAGKMCGIFGHTNLSIENIEASHQALHTLTHRGPDSWGHKVCDSVYVGHRRLSILDLSENGYQPMESEGIYLTVNGEIYNYRELRSRLIKDFNVKFRSDSDSEVILHGYKHWGVDTLLAEIDGMFAFSIYDSKDKKVILARDHVGVKPLYYGLMNGNFFWASELKAIEKFLGDENLNIDPTAIYDFMTYSYIPCPKTMYRDVFKIDPGHYVTFCLDSLIVEKKKYWSLDFSYRKDVTDWPYFIREHLGEAVNEQLVSDVPVGFFLSGGVDSSAVCCEASKILPEIQTFSIGHVDESDDESPYARMVSDRIGSRHFEKFFSQDIANENFALLKTFYDEPFGDVSALPTNEVCRLAREHVTVVLTGDGGDELFGGYSSYSLAKRVFSKERVKWAWLRPIAVFLKTYAPHRSLIKKSQRFEAEILEDPMERWAALKGGIVKTDRWKRLWAKAHNIPSSYDDYWYFRKFDRPDLSPRTRAQYIDFHTYMHDSVLTKVDRASMAVALETRVPFLSKKMIAAAWSIPEDVRYEGNELKAVLKSAYSNQIPHSALFRKKQGFGIGRIRKSDRLYDRAKNIPKQILGKLFPDIVSG